MRRSPWSGCRLERPDRHARAGPHTISAVYSGDESFSTSTSDDQTLNVSRAHLTVTADNLGMDHFDAVPALTYTIAGFANGETASVIQGSPDLSTPATSSSAAGRYPITVGAGSLAADTTTSFPRTASSRSSPRSWMSGSGMGRRACR